MLDFSISQMNSQGELVAMARRPPSVRPSSTLSNLYLNIAEASRPILIVCVASLG